MTIAAARVLLDNEWRDVCRVRPLARLKDEIEDPGLQERIRAAINSPTKSYRYVLPTQMLAKVITPTLDSHCIQASRGGRGCFDARTIAHSVVVPFDQKNEKVLGGAPEPYVNNPLRVPEISRHHMGQQRDRKGWANLCEVLDRVEGADQMFARKVLRQTLIEVRRRLATSNVSYAVPQRISHGKCLETAERFLSERSGGERLQAVAAAVLAVAGRRFRLFSQVRRAKTTAADASTGLLADLEGVSGERVVLVMEVKDRALTVGDLKSKTRSFRTRKVAEAFFLVRGGVESEDQEQIKGIVEREFAAGHNIYVVEAGTFLLVMLALVGEAGRHDFLREVGEQLDRYGADIGHRQTWADLLSQT